MDGFVCNLKNNSDQEQEINLFNSSDQNGQSTKTSYEYVGELGGARPIYNRTSSLFYDQTIIAVPGEVGVSFTKNDGTVLDFRTSVNITNTTASGLEVELNTKLLLNGVGPEVPQGNWTVSIDAGVTVTITLRFDADTDWIQQNDINTNLSGGGSSGFTFATTGLWSAPTGFGAVYLGDTLKGNPNVRVEGFSDFSYNEFLWSTLQRTYDVKNFQIYSANQNQLLEPFLFDRKLASGKKYQKVLTPSIDPYQSQNYIITPDNKGYILDGFTEIKYKLLPNSSVRLILDYTYVDLATPLIAKIEQPQLKPEYITPKFVDNMENGYDKFGCQFLLNRSKALNIKLKDVAGPDGTKHPKWQNQIKSKLLYIKQMMINYDCMRRDEVEELPEFEMIGAEYRRMNLWMPSPEFVQHQLDTEQGARKLYQKHDFPIVVKDF